MGKILEDIRVVDLTDHVFGPYCTMILAAHGAEVIKIEPPWGNTFRVAGNTLIAGACPGFHAVNFNKKGMAVNLKDPKGLEIVKKLVSKSDVVIQNFLPGVMERLGLGYDVLKELNPKIIYAAQSGFGQTGPYKSRASFAGIAQSISGFSRQVGDQLDPDGPPLGMGGAVGDLVPAVFTALSVIAAIRHRDQTGKGQMIDSSQADCMTAINSSIISYSMTGMLPVEQRKKDSNTWRIGGFKKARDGWISVGGLRSKALVNLKNILGVEELGPGDLENYVKDFKQMEAVERLSEMGFAVGPVYSADQIIDDPHLKSRGMIVEIEHPDAGKIITPNYPVQYSGTTAELSMPAPRIGQHNHEVLMELLGYTEADVNALEKDGVIVTKKPGDVGIDKRHPRLNKVK